MSSKLYSLLFVCLLGLTVNCQTKQASSDVLNTDREQKSDVNITDEEIKLLFLDSGLGEGDGNLEKLMTLPKERVVSVVQKIKDNGITKGEKGFQTESQSESLKIKSAYFLWKLGIDSSANERYIVEATKIKDTILKFDAYSFLGVIISEGRKEYLPLIFEIVPEVDGAYAMETHGLFVEELEKSPKIFLQYLSKESFEIREEVYKLISYTEEMHGAKTFEKIKANVRELKTDRELKNIVEEFLLKVDKRRKISRP